MFRPSSVSAWGTVRTVPKRTTPLVRQQHLWRPRPSVPRCVRCCLELLPFQCSRCGGDYWVSHSECLTWYLKEILFALLSRPTTAAGKMGTAMVADQDDHLSNHPKQEIGTDRQAKWCFPASLSHRGIVGTTVERTKMKPSLTQVAASLLAASCAVTPVRAGMAPKNAPDLPENFCPKATGVATATTGECMCNWQDERGCTGSGCKYEMGLSWYHYTCEDCECVPEPKKPRKKKRY